MTRYTVRSSKSMLLLLLLLTHFSRVRLFATPWTAAHQAPPSMGFSRQEYWSGVPLPSLSKSIMYLNLSVYICPETSNKLCEERTAVCV